MYPNPAKEVLTIVPAGTASPIQVSIFNQHGQKVLDKIISPSTTVIPINNLPKGVYFIQLISEGVLKCVNYRGNKSFKFLYVNKKAPIKRGGFY